MTLTLDSYYSAFEEIRRPICLIDLSTREIVANSSFRALLNMATINPLPLEDVIGRQSLNDTELIIKKNSANNEPEVFLTLEKIDDQLLIGYAELASERQANFHAQRLKTLGMISGGVAHDFNNVLTGLLGHITFLKTVLPETGIHSESLQAIEEGSMKAAQLTQQILNFSKLKTVEKLELINLNDLVQRTCTLLRGAISPSNKLEFFIPKDTLCIKAIEGKVAQVIVNLVMNAKAALTKSGVIQVSLELGMKDSEGHQPVSILRVSDNGCGIPENILDRIFEPFFSTKETGTGLGLSTVKRIVDEFGGDIKINSIINNGTEISISFPTVENTELNNNSKPKDKLRRGDENILIIDDEDPVRNVLSVSLRHLGYNVETASCGKEGIELFKNKPNYYNLVLLDMIMPEMPGEEVYGELIKYNNNIKVLVISGFSSEDAVQSILTKGGKGYIQKPFTIEELANKVRDCID
jgi:signal transduction histidine kinase